MTKTIIPLLFIAFLFMAACHNFDEPKKNAFITKCTDHGRWGNAYRSGNVTSEYHFDKQEWTPINVSGTFDEIVWIN